MSARRVVLTGEDVDALRLVAPFAAKSRERYRRTALEVVYVYDGIAYATDSYRLAFTEVDCDDVILPASCVEWLPIDGCTVKSQEDSRDKWLVTWDADGSLVGGWVEKAQYGDGFLTADALLSIVQKAAPKVGDRLYQTRYTLTKEPHYRANFDGPNPSALVASEDHKQQVWVDHRFLKEALRSFGPAGCKVRLGEKPVDPIWLFNDDVTVVQMPIRPSPDLSLSFLSEVA